MCFLIRDLGPEALQEFIQFSNFRSDLFEFEFDTIYSGGSSTSAQWLFANIAARRFIVCWRDFLVTGGAVGNL